MYKDKDKQKAANKQAAQRRRDKAKGMTDVTPSASVIPDYVIPNSHTLTMTPEGPKPEVPTNYGLSDCECNHCRINKSKGGRHILNHGAYKDAGQLADNEMNRVAMPGDVDHIGVVCDACQAQCLG